MTTGGRLSPPADIVAGRGPRSSVEVLSLAVWSDRIPDWPTLRAVMRGEQPALPEPRPLPPSPLLSAAERRRAPESVQLALHVAHQAVSQAGADASQLVSVFASPHGDLGITHALCETLAQDATALSPTRFVNSVHNAVSGHWGMVHRCVQPSTAVAAGRCTFAAGLLEAMSQVACSAEPVLLVAYETTPQGATAQLTGSAERLAVALVLGPAKGAGVSDAAAAALRAKDESSRPRLGIRWRVVSSPTPGVARSKGLHGLERNHLADALVWLEACAWSDDASRAVPAFALSDAGVGDGDCGSTPVLQVEWDTTNDERRTMSDER